MLWYKDWTENEKQPMTFKIPRELFQKTTLKSYNSGSWKQKCDSRLYWIAPNISMHFNMIYFGLVEIKSTG